MTRRRDIIILVGLFVALVVFTLVGTNQATDDDPFEGRPTSYSSNPGGTLALFRWLNEIGYDVERLAFREFTLDPDVEALFIVNPTEPINRTRATRVFDWVEAGGTLILVDDRVRSAERQQGFHEILHQLEVGISRYQGQQDLIERAAILQPIFDQPPVQAVVAETDRVVDTDRIDVAALVGRVERTAEDADEDPNTVQQHTVVLGVQRGEGYIYIVSGVFPFTNVGLRETENAAFLLNLLRRVSPGGQVWFDEYHHGYFEPPSFRGLLLSNAWGWALLYSGLIAVAYLIMTGRRFGKPVPLQEEVTRRSSAEYIESVAEMLQRSGQRPYILHHYYVTFKRRLARPLGINPRLPDQDFVVELGRLRDLSPQQQQELLQLLGRLQSRQVSEEELLRLVRATDIYLEEHPVSSTGRR